MATYKNYRTNQVISEKDYLKLPHSKRMEFSKVYNTKITHSISYDNNNDFELLSVSSFDVSSFGISESSNSFDFGGGDFGGGGAGSDF